MIVQQPANSLVFSLGLVAGGDASESVAEGGAGNFAENHQIAEASLFFRPFLNRLRNPALTIVIFNFLDFDTARDGVHYVGNGWFELWVIGASG